MVRPKDISPPFPKNILQITLHDHVLYVPPRAGLSSEPFTKRETALYKAPMPEDALVPPHIEGVFPFPKDSSYIFPGFETLFGNNNPVFVEFCSGNGHWLIEKAIRHPEINWVAVEKRFDRMKKIWSKIKNHQLQNVLVAFGEGFFISSHFFQAGSVSRVFVNFPDPWPKNKHAKNRIISPSFLQEISRILVNDGLFIFVTDALSYSQLFLSFKDNPLAQTLPSPGYTEPPTDYGTSFFDSLFKSQGKPIFYHCFQKKSFLC